MRVINQQGVEVNIVLDANGNLPVSTGGAPAPPPPSGTTSVSLDKVAGAATITAGAVGLLAVGGSAAPGSPPSGNPVPMGAWDGANTQRVAVSQSHNADNQLPANVSFSVAVAGPTQITNAISNLDRQRETSADNQGALGVVSGSQQLKSPISTTLTVQLVAGGNSATLAATKFVNRGANAWIRIGSVLTFEQGTANEEAMVVTAVNYATNVVTVAGNGAGAGARFTHAISSAVVSGAYNEARDASTPDGATGAGFAAGATYLLNGTLNSSAGGWEGERSAAGEIDGASGSGTAIAAEYECNSGGPPLPSGLPSNLQFDRGRNIQGKGVGTATITAPAASATSVVVPTPAQVNLLQPGVPLYFMTGSTVTEVALVSQTYTPGTSPISLQNALVTGGETTIKFDTYVPAGPGLNGFLPTGIEIADEAVYDPVTNLFYLERSSTQDGVSGQGMVLEGQGLFNGATFDRERSASIGNGVAATGISADAPYLQFNTALPTLTNGQYGVAQADASGRTLTVPSAASVLLGDAIAATNFFPTANSAANVVVTPSFAFAYNGTNWDRIRSAAAGNAIGPTGIQAAAPYVQFNSALPSLGNAQYAAAQADSSGRILVGSIASALPAGSNNIGSVAIGPPAAAAIVSGAQNGTATQAAANISGAAPPANKVFQGSVTVSASAGQVAASNAVGTLHVDVSWVPGTGGTAAQRVASVDLAFAAGGATGPGQTESGHVTMPCILASGTTAGQFTCTVTSTGTITNMIWDVAVNGSAQ